MLATRCLQPSGACVLTGDPRAVRDCLWIARPMPTSSMLAVLASSGLVAPACAPPSSVQYAGAQ
eukprot:734695-Alexandrium_andersonii.AAC.1